MNTTEGPVPLFGLPVLHPFWTEKFWLHRGNNELVSGQAALQVYASHDPHTWCLGWQLQRLG